VRWITALNLAQWAEKLTSRSDLPRLVEDLILASAPTITSLRFPNGISARYAEKTASSMQEVLGYPMSRRGVLVGSSVSEKISRIRSRMILSRKLSRETVPSGRTKSLSSLHHAHGTIPKDLTFNLGSRKKES